MIKTKSGSTHCTAMIDKIIQETKNKTCLEHMTKETLKKWYMVIKAKESISNVIFSINEDKIEEIKTFSY